jgi:hypothetical protein
MRTTVVLLFVALLSVPSFTQTDRVTIRVDASKGKGPMKAGQLQLLGSPEWLSATNGRVTLKFDLSRQGVSLLKLTW